MTKRLFIKTYGCQMNVYDSARMADVLAPLGYAPGDDAEGADLVAAVGGDATDAFDVETDIEDPHLSHRQLG